MNSAAWQGCKHPALKLHTRGTRLGDNTPEGSWDWERLSPTARDLPPAGQQPEIKNQPQEGRGSSAACSGMEGFQAQIRQTTRGAKKLRWRGLSSLAADTHALLPWASLLQPEGKYSRRNIPIFNHTLG